MILTYKVCRYSAKILLWLSFLMIIVLILCKILNLKELTEILALFILFFIITGLMALIVAGFVHEKRPCYTF